MDNQQRLIELRKYMQQIVTACKDGDSEQALTLLSEMEYEFMGVVTPHMVAQCEQLIHDHTTA